MSQNQEEMILAQEQGVINKPTHLSLKANLEGTLILTNKRIIFVSADQSIELLSDGTYRDESTGGRIAQETANLGTDMLGGYLGKSYANVEDILNMPANPKNLFVAISSIRSISGHKGIVGRPNLKLGWKDSAGEVRNTEFEETLTERTRKKNLSDWANVVQKLKDGSLLIQKPTTLPQSDSTEGRIYYIMGDMQTKGILEAEEETEKQFGIQLEPEEVEAACERLVSMGLLDEIPDPSGDTFYKKHSPLGEDDLSS